MRLREWKYINTPTTTSASASSNTGFKKRLERLIKYHGDNLPVDVDYLMVGLLTKDKLEFAEQYDDDHVEEYKISIDPSTESWKVEIFINRQPDENFSGTGWPELLKSLRPCIVVPETRELEYKNLLTEWVAMNNKPSSSGYKKRFEKLFKYHIDHASSELERVNNKVIDEYDFHLSEHYNTGSDEFNRTIIVSVNKYTDEFFLSIFVDGKEVYHNVYKSYEEVLEVLTDTYMFLPDAGTQEYDDLLTESLNEWHLMNPPKASQLASSTTLYKNKFKKLLDYHLSNDYHIKHGSSQGTVELLSEDSDKALFKFKDTWMGGSTIHETIIAAAYFKKDASWWILKMVDGEQKESIDGNDFNELVKKLYRYFTLPATNSSEYQALLEEVNSSIAEDFQIYDFLWENI